MISLERVFDLDKDVYGELGSIETELLPLEECNLKCVGYRSGTFLFAYDNLVQDIKVTKMGWYCISSRQIKILYTHSSVMNVLVASVNKEHTLLAYAKKKRDKSVYTSHLVELINAKLFELNIETSHIQYLMFLPWKNAKERGNRKEYLLFYMEKRTLGLIHVTTTENNANKVEVHHIQKEVLVQHYIWYQLDLNSMKLYYIYLQRCVVEGEVRNSCSRFNVLQFSCRHNPDVVLSVELPLPLSPDLYNTTSKRYMVGPVSSQLPDGLVHISVIQTDTCSLVLCIHYSNTYYIYILHTGILVECKTGSNPDINLPVLFLHLHQYIVVYTPKHVLHFIDVSSSHASRSNMVLEDIPTCNPLISDEDLEQVSNKPMPLCSLMLDDHLDGIMVNLKILYKASLTPSSILTLYKSTECTVTWCFLVHVALCHLKDVKLTHKMVLHSITTVPNVKILDVFKDYIILATYMKLADQDVSTSVLSAVPFTEENTKLSVLNRNRVLKITNVLQLITHPIISAQKGVLLAEAGPFIRFNLEDFMSRCGSMVKASRTPSSSSTPSSCIPCHPASRASMSSSEGSPSSSITCNEEDESLVDTLNNALVYHLRRRFNETVSLNVCTTTSKWYFTHLVNQAKVVMSVILIAVGQHPDWCPDQEDLTSPLESGLVTLCKLFNVLKYMLLQTGCPVPHTFEWLHVYAAYKSMILEVFLRQVQNKSIRVTPVIIRKFLLAFPSNTCARSLTLCTTLISTLTSNQAHKILSSWDCTVRRQYYCQYQLVALRSKAGLGTPAQPESETPGYLRTHPFIPANSFYSYLYHKTSETTAPQTQMLQYLSQHAMEHTRATVGDATLSNITF